MTIDWNGLYLSPDNTKLALVNNADSLIASVKKRARVTHKIKCSGKDITFNKHGIILSRNFAKLKEETQVKLNVSAFLSILNLLRIPVGYADRIPNSLLLRTLNELMYGVENISLMIRDNEVLGAYISNKVERQTSAYSLLENIFWGENPRELSFAIMDKHSISVFFRTKNFNDFSLGLELYITDVYAHPYMISGWALSKMGHALFGNLEFPITRGKLKLAQNSIENFYVLIEHEVDKMNLNQLDLDGKLGTTYHSIKTLYKLQRAKIDSAQTIKEKRKLARGLGDILRLACTQKK